MITKRENGTNIVIFESVEDLLKAATIQDVRSVHGFTTGKLRDRLQIVENTLYSGTNPFYEVCQVADYFVTDFVREQFEYDDRSGPYSYYFKTSIPRIKEMVVRKSELSNPINITIDGVEHSVESFKALVVAIPTANLLEVHKQAHPGCQHQLFVNHKQPTLHIPVSKKFDANKLAHKVRPIMASIIRAQRDLNKNLGYAMALTQPMQIITNHLLNPVANLIIGPAIITNKSGMEKRKSLRVTVDSTTLTSCQIASLLYALAYTKLDAEALCKHLFADWDTDTVLNSAASDVHYIPTAHFDIRRILINNVRSTMNNRGANSPVHVIDGMARAQFNALVNQVSSGIDGQYKPNFSTADATLIESTCRHACVWFKGLCNLTDIVWEEMFEGVDLLSKVKGMSTEDLKKLPLEEHINDILVNFLPVRGHSVGIYNKINEYFSIQRSRDDFSDRPQRHVAPDTLVTSQNRFFGYIATSYIGFDAFNTYLKEQMAQHNDHLVTTIAVQAKVMGRHFDTTYSYKAPRNRIMLCDYEINDLVLPIYKFLDTMSDNALHDAMYRGYLLAFLGATFPMEPDSFAVAFSGSYSDSYYMFTGSSFASIKYFPNKDSKDRFTSFPGKNSLLSSTI